jgi:hypothetical protein
MATLNILICDCCGRQEQQPNDLHWSGQIKTIDFLNTPGDGMKYAKWQHDLCHECRYAINDAVTEARVKVWNERKGGNPIIIKARKHG